MGFGALLNITGVGKMSKVNDWSIELHEMVFTLMSECPQCNGAGECEVDYHMPHNSGRDIGEIETRIEQCDMCDGSGEIEREDEGE